jgi:hypothetical protein
MPLMRKPTQIALHCSTRILPLLGALLLTMPLDAAQTRSPELAVLDQLVGTWRSTFIEGGAQPQVTYISRYWSEEGTMLLERAIRPSGDFAFAVWTYNPDDGSYPAVVLASKFAAHWVSKWDAEQNLFTYSYMSVDGRTGLGKRWRVNDDQFEWTMTLQTPEGEVAMQGKQERIADQSWILREPEGPWQILRHFNGTWSSKLTNSQNEDVHIGDSVTNWAGPGSKFQVTSERGLGGNEKYSAITYDPAAERYRGVFIEPGSAGFFDAWWDSKAKQLKQVFSTFPSIKDFGESAPPKPQFGLNVNGWHTRTVIADGIHRSVLTVRMGDEELWSGRGTLKRETIADESWPLTVAGGKGLVILSETEAGVTLGMQAGGGVRAFIADHSIRLVDRPELSLQVGDFSEIRFEKAGTPFKVNPEGSISPTRSPNWALGWQGGLKLVRRSDANVLIFTEVPRPKPPPTNYEYRLEDGKLFFVTPGGNQARQSHPASVFDIPDLQITSVAPWGSLCWIGTNSGLFRFDAQALSWSRFAIARTELSVEIDSMKIVGETLLIEYAGKSASFNLKTRTWLSAAAPSESGKDPENRVDQQKHPKAATFPRKSLLMLIIGALALAAIALIVRKISN